MGVPADSSVARGSPAPGGVLLVERDDTDCAGQKYAQPFSVFALTLAACDAVPKLVQDD